MKKWEIKIKTTDEAQAVSYLRMLVGAFDAAVMLNQPMEEFSVEGSKDYLKCKLDHPIFMHTEHGEKHD